MSSKTVKKLLLSLIVVGILGSFTAGGTYALLTGEGSNPNDSIASGTLTMDNTVGAGARVLATRSLSPSRSTSISERPVSLRMAASSRTRRASKRSAGALGLGMKSGQPCC